jgi:ABC-type branched-subunit amino acid transport system substrate-binding protein
MILSASLRTPARRFALGICLSIAALSGCTTPEKAPPPPVVEVAPPPTAAHPLDQDQPGFLRPPNIAASRTPVRVGVILPFANGTAATRNLAAAMMNAAELALFDSSNRDIVLMTADEGNAPADAAAAAEKLLGQGAEIIIGPLFGPSVSAVAPIARDRGVPVLAFSTEKTVAGKGVYLLSFLPQNEVTRVVSYAVAQGHHNLAAMVPQGPYGDLVTDAFQNAVKAAGANLSDIEHFGSGIGQMMAPSQAIAKSNADAVMIAQGGPLLRSIAPSLAGNGLDPTKVKLLGTGLWYDTAVGREQTLAGGWFAAPEPNADKDFNAKYKNAYGANPPQLAALAYDAVSLVALLSPGIAYHRFTQAALMDPNGFSGVNGIFRFQPDGTSQRGLAILEVTSDGFNVVSPAPKTFQSQGS